MQKIIVKSKVERNDKMEMSPKYYIDMGSSTIKVNSYEKGILTLVEEKSVILKKNFSEEQGISSHDYLTVFRFLMECTKKYSLTECNTRIIATGIWRQIPKSQWDSVKADIHDRGLTIERISHDQENYYFQKAMQGIYEGKRILMVNMGGKTTELVVIDKGNVKEKVNLNLGVGDILKQFPTINDIDQAPSLDEILMFAKDKITESIDFSCDCAIHTGGELRFQQLANYHLVPNTIFHDVNHPYMVSLTDFQYRNQEILEKVTLAELREWLPQNPTWMDEAKAGAILGQAIFEKANVPYIVPSDLNIIHGVVKEENNLLKQK